MSYHTRFLYSTMLVAAYLLCASHQLAQSSPVQNSNPIKTSSLHEFKRISGDIERRSVSDKQNEASKFQARMMRPDNQQSVSSSFFSSSDAWHPHNLMPTFTDQEQGDEMVALASDSEPEHVKVVAPPRNRSSYSDSKYDDFDPSFLPAFSSEKSVKESQRSNDKKQQQAEDFFGEDDDEDEEPSKPGKGEFDILSNRDRKEQSGGEKLRPEVNNDRPFGNYLSPASLDQLYQRQSESAKNQSIRAPLSTPENGWIPRSYTPSSSPHNSFMPSYTPAQSIYPLVPNFSSPAPPSYDSSDNSTPQSAGGNKLTNLFGARDTLNSFNKANVAIEYLRSILKAKQNSLNNTTSSPLTVIAKQQADGVLDKNSNLQRLANRLNQIFENNSATFGSFISPNQTLKLDQVVSEAKPIKEEPHLPTLHDLIGAKYLPSLQTQTKISITDVKTVQPTYPTPDYFSSTSKSPEEDSSVSNAQTAPADISIADMQINGTPLGGDYIESYDDFPRAARQHQHLFPLDSKPIPSILAQKLPDILSTSQSQVDITNKTVEQLDDTKTEKQEEPKRQAPKQPSLKPLNEQRPTSSKIYHNDQSFSYQTQIAHQPISPSIKPVVTTASSTQVQPKGKKVVGYNYDDSSAEINESELMGTNYQLGDSLYSPTGGVEQILSNSELDAIQNQFMAAEQANLGLGRPVISPFYYQEPVSPTEPQRQFNVQEDLLQKLYSPAKQAEEMLKEMSTNNNQMSVMARPILDQVRKAQQKINQEAKRVNPTLKPVEQDAKRIITPEKPVELDVKKKNLIVYLNHPRPADMSKSDDQSEQTFVSAKEFDSNGFSKGSKHLDVSDLHNYEDLKDGIHDKDGLSVVVIGDAYKYKKIVLLISSKSGGLKFIPMVKDR